MAYKFDFNPFTGKLDISANTTFLGGLFLYLDQSTLHQTVSDGTSSSIQFCNSTVGLSSIATEWEFSNPAASTNPSTIKFYLPTSGFDPTTERLEFTGDQPFNIYAFKANYTDYAQIQMTSTSINYVFQDGGVFTNPFNVGLSTVEIDVNSTTALLVEQSGVKNDVFVVDTTNGRIGVNTPSPTADLGVGEVGSEKITNGTFTGGSTGWTYSDTEWSYSSNAMNKDAAGVGTLYQESAGMVTPLVSGETYLLTAVMTNHTSGSVVPSCGGVSMEFFTGNATHKRIFTAISTADLVFTPSSASRFTIDTISLKKLTGTALVNSSLNVTGDTTIGGGLNIGQGASGAVSGRIALGKAYSSHSGYGNLIEMAGGICMQRPYDYSNTYLLSVFNTSGTMLGYVLLDNYSSTGVDPGNNDFKFYAALGSLYFTTNTADENIYFYFNDGGVSKVMYIDGASSQLRLQTDDMKIVFGAGNDASIYYDGTNMIINPRLVGTGSLVIGAGSAGVDYRLMFDGETNDGIIDWMEDEDYFKFSDDIMMLGGENIVLDTTTGTKIGTATSQLLGFYNATPVNQPDTVADPSGGGTQDAEARTAINAIIDRLQELGLIA
jgi:hypothetical protein